MAWLWWLLAPTLSSVVGAWLFWLRGQAETHPGGSRGRSGIDEHQALLRALSANHRFDEPPATMIVLGAAEESGESADPSTELANRSAR